MIGLYCFDSKLDVELLLNLDFENQAILTTLAVFKSLLSAFISSEEVKFTSWKVSVKVDVNFCFKSYQARLLTPVQLSLLQIYQ